MTRAFRSLAGAVELARRSDVASGIGAAHVWSIGFPVVAGETELALVVFEQFGKGPAGRQQGIGKHPSRVSVRLVVMHDMAIGADE